VFFISGKLIILAASFAHTASPYFVNILWKTNRYFFLKWIVFYIKSKKVFPQEHLYWLKFRRKIKPQIWLDWNIFSHLGSIWPSTQKLSWWLFCKTKVGISFNKWKLIYTHFKGNVNCIHKLNIYVWRSYTNIIIW